jgi:hypothetical protein
MYFKLNEPQENYLLNQPETGMGFQVIEAIRPGNHAWEKFLVLNSEIVIEMNIYQAESVRKVIKEGIYSIKSIASIIDLKSITVLNEMQFRNVVNESKSANERGAIDNDVVNVNGEEIFVRLSAFDNDRRIDKVNKCLRSG